MRTAIIGVLVLLLGAGCVNDPPSATGAGTASTATSVLEDRAGYDFTLRVRNRDCFTAGSGSAFLVEPDVLVTNRHVVKGAIEVTVSTWRGQRADVEVARMRALSDLAVIELTSPLHDLPVVELGSNPEAGDSVRAVGYPLGGPVTVTHGEVIDVVDGSQFGELGQVVRFDADIEPGSSGGPLIAPDGSVVGVVFAIEKDTGYGLAVPVETLKHHLDSPRRGIEVRDCAGQ